MRDLARLFRDKTKLRRHRPDRVLRGSRIRVVDGERVHARSDVGGHRIDVIGRRQSPAASIVEEAVVSQMIVGVRHQDVEHQPAPQLAEVLRHLRALLAQDIDDIQVAAYLVVVRR